MLDYENVDDSGKSIVFEGDLTETVALICTLEWAESGTVDCWLIDPNKVYHPKQCLD